MRLTPSQISQGARRVAVALVATALLSSCASRQPAAQPGQQPQPAASTEQGPKLPFTTRMMGWVSSIKKIIPRKQRPPQALPARQIGEIRQVNLENRFVLIDAGAASSITPGAQLVTIADQRETSDLRLTPLRSASFLIADITDGKPSVGDKVYAR